MLRLLKLLQELWVPRKLCGLTVIAAGAIFPLTSCSVLYNLKSVYNKEFSFLSFLNISGLYMMGCHMPHLEHSKNYLPPPPPPPPPWNRWFSRYVIAAMLVDKNNSFLISSFCSSTSICTFHHCYLCLKRLVANNRYLKIIEEQIGLRGFSEEYIF